MLIFAAALSVSLAGPAIGISDGDTLTVLIDRRAVKVRLAEIDAPESRQPFATRSKQSLSELCYGKPSKLDVLNTDRYGRTVARIRCADIDANAEQVRRGMAWVFGRYAARDSPLYVVQNEARVAARGLWADAHPVPPWEWRKRPKREKTSAHRADLQAD